ncbi:hypothetical protein ACP4OV_019198 [Aristida adscensionis]
MARRRRRRRGVPCGRAPPELRLAYGTRARPLGHAVLSLLPPSGSPCPACRGAAAGCLACRRWAHLLRDGDPVAYRRLVTRAICAVAPRDAAPPPPRYTPGSSGLSQAKLVRETIKLMLADGSSTAKNVLCSGCHESGKTRSVIELVSSSSWDILLHRIGDLLMCYVMRHFSIFLPIKKNDFFQVTGLPINVVLQKPLFANSMAKNKKPQSTADKCPTCYLRRKTEIPENISGGNCINNSNSGLFSLDSSTWKFGALQSSGSYDTARITEHNHSREGHSSSKLPFITRATKCSGTYTQNSRKRKRPYSWQRHTKQKQSCSEDRSSTGRSNISNSNFNVCSIVLEDSGAKANDELQSSAMSSDVAMRRDVNNSKTEEPLLSSEKSPKSDFDIRPSLGLSGGYSKSRIQSTCPHVGPPNFLQLNWSPLLQLLNIGFCQMCTSRFIDIKTRYLLQQKDFAQCLPWQPCIWLIKLVKQLIRNSKRCQYKKLFRRHCSAVPKVATNVSKSDSKAQFSGGDKSAYNDQSFVQLEAYSTHQQVVSFVWAVLTRILPEPLLGNSFSKRSLRINIWKFIKLRRFETFHLSDCVGELKLSHYPWISNFGLSDCFCSARMVKEIGSPNGLEEQKHTNLLHCWINWLFSDIVIPLVQAYFYVTERESRRYDSFYYPKTVWRDLTSNAVASLDPRILKILRGTSRRVVKRSFCFSRVRFVPKAKDMRSLVNLKAKSKDRLLSKCHLIIKKVRDENPEMFGSSVFNYNNVHQNLSHFISSVTRDLKKKFKIYIVVADVSKAFDSIDQDMILKIVDDVLESDEHVLRKCTKVLCNRSKNAIYRFDSSVSISTGNNICDLSIQSSSSGGILVDQGKISSVRKKELQRLIYEQVKHNILKIGQNFYLQQVGIAQGSKLSPNLCSLYYGHLENSVLSRFLHDSQANSGEDVLAPKSLLMRMRRGFVHYNCYMNESKYGFNFEVSNSNHCCNRLYRGDDGISFIPWSGLLINCETLEIQADYTRYLDINISSTITVKMHSSLNYLESKLYHYMRPKCHPIFYDSMINSPGTVRLNIYQAFLLCAMKFHCYVRSMPDVNISRLEMFHIIKRTFRYMHSLIVRRTQDVELQYDVRPVLKLSKKETMWLGLSAYLRVLRKKQSRYKDLMALLIEEIGRYGHLDRGSDSLSYAVDDSHSSMFWKFKF